MAVEKLSVSFPNELAAAVRELADDNDESVSAFLVAAAKQRVRDLLLQRYIEDVAAEHGWDLEELADEGDRILAEAANHDAANTGHAA
jgi:hypothetical protein